MELDIAVISCFLYTVFVIIFVPMRLIALFKKDFLIYTLSMFFGTLTLVSFWKILFVSEHIDEIGLGWGILILILASPVCLALINRGYLKRFFY